MFLVKLRQIYNNWKKIEEHVRVLGKKRIEANAQPILDKIKQDTINFA